MTRNVRTLSVALILALGPGATATSVHADQTAASISAGPLSYMRLSEAAAAWFDTQRASVSSTAAQASPTGTNASLQNAPVYYPPWRGAPATRIGGGSRGLDGTDWALWVLAPEHTGLTTRSSPTLYWYTSKAVSGRQTQITVIKQGAMDPVLETTLPGSAPPGINRLDLSRWGVELDTGTEYQWFVSVVRNPAQRSKDLTAGGTIQRIDSDPGIQARLSGSEARAAPFIYAEQGIWYDAIDTLSRLIEDNPTNGTLRHHRAALLRQVDLVTIADNRDDG